MIMNHQSKYYARQQKSTNRVCVALTGSKSTILATNCFTFTQLGRPRLPEESKMNTRSNGVSIEHTGTVVNVEIGPAVVV